MAARGIERSRTQRGTVLWVISTIFAVIGTLDSAYLSWLKFTHQESRCIAGLGDCFSVNTSKYAVMFGIPIAVFGLAAYLVVIAFLLLENRPGFWGTSALMGVFGMSLFGVLFSAYLTYLEIAVIHAICPYCVVSALCMLGLFIISIVRLALPASEPY